MKRFILYPFLAVMFVFVNLSYAQYRNPEVAWGLSAGGAHGNNIAGDAWMMQYRGFGQINLISPMLIGQVGVGYVGLEAPGTYYAQTGIVDARLLFSPFERSNLNPYVFGGLAVSKALNSSGSSLLPMVPLGAGIQTVISRGTLIDINGGFNFSLSDELDGRTRSSSNLNVLTNQKQDGFYGFTIGLVFAICNSYAN